MSLRFHILLLRRALPLVAILAFGRSSLFASGLTSGHYQFQVQYALVCLYGTYPIMVNTMTTNCYLSVNIDPTGTLSGILNIRTLPGTATGTFTSQNDSSSLHLHVVGQDPFNTVTDIDAQLYGTSQFVGTATLGDNSGFCLMDVSAAGALVITFGLDITVDPQGAVIGAGIASGCGVQVPVNITGSNGPSNCSLHIVGANLPTFTWDGSGSATDTGFIAAWSANGFGAIASGTGLAITAPSSSSTPTASPTPILSPSPSPTATATAAATAIFTPTPTATATFTPTVTATATLTPAATATATGTATATAVPTATATFTPTPIATTTPLPSPTPTPTATATSTPTSTPAMAPAAPKAKKATNVTATSFTANWSNVSAATSYRLDASMSRSFSNYLPGYQNLDVGNVTSRNVTGLNANTIFYYRLRACNGNGTSPNSNVVRAKTKAQ